MAYEPTAHPGEVYVPEPEESRTLPEPAPSRTLAELEESAHTTELSEVWS